MLANLPIAEAAPALHSEATGAKSKSLQLHALGLLASYFDRSADDEPGRLHLLESMLHVMETTPELPPDVSDTWNTLRTQLGSPFMSTVYALLALDPHFSLADKMALLRECPRPHETMTREGLHELARILLDRRDIYKTVFEQEIADTLEWEPRVRQLLQEGLDAKDRGRLATSVASLGLMGYPEDAPRIAAHLQHDWRRLRESTSLTLAQMGAAAYTTLAELCQSTTPQVRVLATLAVGQSTDPDTFQLIEQQLTDPDPAVRRAAITSLYAAEYTRQEQRKTLFPHLERLAAEDPSAEVRLAARTALDSF